MERNDTVELLNIAFTSIALAQKYHDLDSVTNDLIENIGDMLALVLERLGNND